MKDEVVARFSATSALNHGLHPLIKCFDENPQRSTGCGIFPTL